MIVYGTKKGDEGYDGSSYGKKIKVIQGLIYAVEHI